MHNERQNGGTETHISTVDARSGSRTQVTRNILVVSLILVVGLLIIAVGVGYFETDQTGADGVNSGNATRSAAGAD